MAGLVCISTPFSKDSLAAANNNYETHKTPALSEAELNWSQNQDDASFAKWLSEYGVLYFKNSEGRTKLLNDKVSSAFFKDSRTDVLDKEVMLESLEKQNGIKVFICGKDDKLLPSNILKNDANLGKFDFYEIEHASHFVTIDQPEEVARLIETKLLRS